MDPLFEAALSGSSNEDLLDLWKQISEKELPDIETEKCKSLARLDLISILALKDGNYSVALASEKERNRIRERKPDSSGNKKAARKPFRIVD